MKAIILAAGKGKRVRPLTLDKPKPMLEMLGKPLLHHIIDVLPEEITELILVVGYKGEQIREYFGTEFEDKKITYVIQEYPKGTAHALQLCEKYISKGEKFLFLYADDLHTAEALQKLVKHNLAVLVAWHENPAKRFGVVEIDETGRVTGMEEKPEKPKSNFVTPGGFVFDDRVFNYELKQHPDGEYYVPDIINELIKDYDVYTEITDAWYTIGYPEDVALNEERMRKEEGDQKLKYTIPVVVLCGGMGTRMPESEKDLPKLLVNIAGKPMLQHKLDHLEEQGFHNITLALGYKADQIIDWLKETGRDHIKYVIEKERLDTGGAIKFAVGNITEPFIATNGDVLNDINFRGLVKVGENGRNVITGVKLDDVSGMGVLEYDEETHIYAFKEKEASGIPGIGNAGAYYLQPDIFKDKKGSFSIEKEIFPQLIKQKNVFIYEHRGVYWFDCGTPERLKKVRDYFSKKDH